jgi:anti-sigma B factor antagonist
MPQVNGPVHGTYWPTEPQPDSVRLVELKVSSASQGGHAVVTANGELDLYTAPRLQTELAALLRENIDRVVVDLSGVEFCDSTGMNVLLAAMKRAKEKGGVLELAAPRPAVRRILQVTGLDTVFTVLDAMPVDVT